MHETLNLLDSGTFPTIHRERIETVQVNLGYKCNQSCLHCHVNASPDRKESMSKNTMNQVRAFIKRVGAKTVDLTGGAPELNPHFRDFVRHLRDDNVSIIDRCNLTILSEPDQSDLAQFLADQQITVIASLPCYTEDNVDAQRGDGVFQRSIKGLQMLNELGYGQDESGLALNLVYNPTGPFLPPPQNTLETEYKEHLWKNYGVIFNSLLTITNMPIKRFGSTLVSRKQFDTYMSLLKKNFDEKNLSSVMCKTLVSVDWEGYLFDCDFNQMLELNIENGNRKINVSDLESDALSGRKISVKDHCFGCTAGQGSSCGGSLQ
ncbi:MAG: arsenosugar biosynthesis radical SAM (seleno)protein ArsS [Betaproteobacteria bacterium]